MSDDGDFAGGRYCAHVIDRATKSAQKFRAAGEAAMRFEGTRSKKSDKIL